MSKPRDMSNVDPAAHLMGIMAGGQSDYITGMESQGQREVVQSESLPSESLRDGDDDALRALGLTLGEPYDDDPLFRPATLPEGWRREPTDHALWSRIVDERGIDRVLVFYKAAFYDRKAHVSVVNVGGSLAGDFIYGDSDGPRWGVLTDDERESFLSALRDMLAQAEEFPHIYGEYVPRVRAKLTELEGS